MNTLIYLRYNECIHRRCISKLYYEKIHIKIVVFYINELNAINFIIHIYFIIMYY